MPLTRHFYEADEVRSALYYTASRRDLKECEFWCHEMIVSGYESEAISVLFESWLWQRGPFYLRWLIDTGSILMADEVTHDDILNAAVQLSAFGEWDNSVWTILTATDQVVDRVTPKTPSFVPKDCSEEVLYLYRALYQGKARSAFLMSRKINDVWAILKEYGTHLCVEYDTCFTILERYELLLGYRSDKYDVVILCVAVLMLCLSDKKRVASFLPRSTPARILSLPIGAEAALPIGAEAALPIGTKAARLYSIPSVALYGTARGLSLCSEYHTNGLHDIEKAIKGCPFWDDALKEYQRQGKWVSDDALKAFYDEYFPNDIPDEWSKEEKMKSHGQGLLNKGEKMTLVRYARIHFMKPSRLGFTIKGRKLDDEGSNPLDAIRLDESVEIIMKPIRRKYKI